MCFLWQIQEGGDGAIASPLPIKYKRKRTGKNEKKKDEEVGRKGDESPAKRGKPNGYSPTCLV